MRKTTAHTYALLRIALVFVCLAFASCGKPEKPEAAPAQEEHKSIVSLGGSVTEIVFALGAGADVVGTDLSSTYPEEVTKLPRVGYWRTLSAEGVLSLKPTIVIADHDAGPASSLQQIEKAGVSVKQLGQAMQPADIRTKIMDIAALLGRTDEGKKLADRVDSEYAAVKKLVDSLPGKPRTLFVYMRGASIFSAGGTNTHADAMIRLCGGENAAAAIDGMKPVSPEFFVQGRPEVLIVTKSGMESAGGIEALRARPGLSESPAVRNNNIVVVDDLAFLGFGPRMPEAARQVVEAYTRVLAQAHKGK